jgi:hypothetical protein
MRIYSKYLALQIKGCEIDLLARGASGRNLYQGILQAVALHIAHHTPGFLLLLHLSVGERCLLVGGIPSQAERPQSRSLFPHGAKFDLALGHCLLVLTQLLFFLEQSFGATMRLIRIHAQSRNSLGKAE